MVAEHGDGTGAGAIRAGQGATYPPADGNEETSKVGEAGQYEDAERAAARAGEAARDAGADKATQAEAESGAEEEVLPSGG